jgi:histidine ammonia-lyase
VLLTRLHSLVTGGSKVRLAVMEGLAAALNAPTPPPLCQAMHAGALQAQLIELLAAQEGVPGAHHTCWGQTRMRTPWPALHVL